MALPESLVDLIFGRMLTRYGALWIAKWAGLPIADVRADWADVMGQLGVVAINHGLMHLPEDSVPNAMQFRRLCLNRPEPAPPRLPAPRADSKRVAAILAEMRAKQSLRKPLQWAQELRERERQGDALTEHQSKAWRAALRDHHEAPIGSGQFTPIPDHALPPGMRS